MLFKKIIQVGLFNIYCCYLTYCVMSIRSDNILNAINVSKITNGSKPQHVVANVCHFIRKTKIVWGRLDKYMLLGNQHAV